MSKNIIKEHWSIDKWLSDKLPNGTFSARDIANDTGIGFNIVLYRLLYLVKDKRLKLFWSFYCPECKTNKTIKGGHTPVPITCPSCKHIIEYKNNVLEVIEANFLITKGYKEFCCLNNKRNQKG